MPGCRCKQWALRAGGRVVSPDELAGWTGPLGFRLGFTVGFVWLISQLRIVRLIAFSGCFIACVFVIGVLLDGFEVFCCWFGVVRSVDNDPMLGCHGRWLAWPHNWCEDSWSIVVLRSQRSFDPLGELLHTSTLSSLDRMKDTAFSYGGRGFMEHTIGH